MVEVTRESLRARKNKGLNIAAQELVEQLSESVFVVKGSGKNVYRVLNHKPFKLSNGKMSEEKWTCDCWDFKARGKKTGMDCKHITASKVFVALSDGK